MREIEIYKDIGRKIRVFRNLKGFSQLDLELAMGASTGTISRIESGDTNPTKETILRIAKVLKLNSVELDYLIGFTSQPASLEEIADVRRDIAEFIATKGVLAYVVDERSRMIDISDSFIKLGKLPPKETFLMTSMIRLTFDYKYGLRQHLDGEEFQNTAFLAILRNYQEMYFMEGDEVYNDIIKFLEVNEEAKQVWDDVKRYNDKYKVRNEDTRIVYFKINGVKVKMNYSVEALWSNQRFRILQYKPTNFVTNLLMTLA